MRLLLTGGTGALGRAVLPLPPRPGTTCACPRATSSTCSTPTPWRGPCATSTRCCTWPRAFARSRSSTSPSGGTRTPATEDTPVAEVSSILRSALAAEGHTDRFARTGRRGVVLRLGLLDGPGTGNDEPVPALGATLHVEDAAGAHLAALELASGIYNVGRDGERVSNRRFVAAAGWQPRPGMVGAVSR
ncbi:MAG TPA: hypothetical protein VH231_02895 [Solirubrobacteraceae bacterium]|nr:hypothetical protein [Solirubrobacteraceae bacterium]